MRKAIVTGANGFIGTALCKELSRQGISVIAVVRNKEENVSSIESLRGLRIVYSDLSEFKNLHEVISDRDVDVLYHLAWVGSAGPLRGNAEVQFNNIKYTCDTVEACSKMDCKRFVFASSIMEYEIEAVMSTDATPGINTLYSSAKVSADYMARTIAGSLGIDYIRAVISNIFGPGELSPRLVNTSIRKLLNGEHCAFSAGEQTYDFIYIDDAAKTFVAIGEKGVANRTYYIGSQNPKPLKEFLCELRDQVDPNIEIGLGEIPFNGVSLTYNEFNIHAVKEDTGFVPTVSFSEGIQNTIKWIKEN
ncbi:NAD-dependent epimerase/dehydratase family protein [Blautia sp. HCP3S3_G3]|uniref:NAD-dependent epimerase/dehydratase family protein n=1 Tax=Blautia sp. HCP3S3_G3 TaxID=3438913 RepID=UPI003F8CC920